MDTQYKEALSLYNQCEYEKAYDILSNLSLNAEDKESRLLEECKRKILQQYIYLINESEKEGDIGKANQLRRIYTFKYGESNEISEFKEDTEYAKKIFLLFASLIIGLLFIAFLISIRKFI